MRFRGLQQIVLFAAIASTLVLVGCDKAELAEVQVQDNINGTPIEGQYIVVLKTDVFGSASQVSKVNLLRQASRMTAVRRQLLSALELEAGAVKEIFEGAVNGFTATLTTEQAAMLRKRGEVAYMEPNQHITLAKPVNEVGEIKQGKIITKPANNTLPYTSITPLDGEHVPWNIERVGYGDGTGKTVWVIDSGVDTDHPDLNVDLTKSRSFIYGVTSVEDGFGHGTKVAGIIGAKNNGSGMIGVASNATIAALRVFDDAGQGTTSRVVSAINYAVANGLPGDVVNISLGGGISSTLDHTVKLAAEKGFKFAIAAGNRGIDCSGTSPARLDAPNVYTISAVNNFNQLWESSNYGLPVDFAAPGVNITSTILNGRLGTGCDGTSFAAPHVAGILLLRPDIVAHGTVTGDKDSRPEPVASAKSLR